MSVPSVEPTTEFGRGYWAGYEAGKRDRGELCVRLLNESGDMYLERAAESLRQKLAQLPALDAGTDDSSQPTR